QQPTPVKPKPFKALVGCCGLPAVPSRNMPEKQSAPVPNAEVAAVGDTKLPSVLDVVTESVLALAFLGITAWLLRHRRPPAFLWALAPLVAAGVGLFLAYWI